MAPAAVIDMRDVRFAYPATGPSRQTPFALSVDSLQVAPGQSVACIGPSGAGKSTLMNIISGCLLADEGRVAVLGQELRSLGEPKRRQMRLDSLGLIFQELELISYLSARDNIMIATTLGAALDPAALPHRLSALAESTHIAHLLGALPAKLSQGERQRVALCRALLTSPKLVLCDEPTGNLDPASAFAVIDLLLGECRRAGAAVVMITHNHQVLDRFDRVVEVTRRGGGAVVLERRASQPQTVPNA